LSQQTNDDILSSPFCLSKPTTTFCLLLFVPANQRRHSVFSFLSQQTNDDILSSPFCPSKPTTTFCLLLFVPANQGRHSVFSFLPQQSIKCLWI
jgi:hypothetical protein